MTIHQAMKQFKEAEEDVETAKLVAEAGALPKIEGQTDATLELLSFTCKALDSAAASVKSAQSEEAVGHAGLFFFLSSFTVSPF